MQRKVLLVLFGTLVLFAWATLFSGRVRRVWGV